MRKNLNKIVAFAIGVSVIGGSIVPAMAAETNVTYIDLDSIAAENKSKLLTLDEAIDGAINNSEALKKLDNTIEFYEKKSSLNNKINNIKEDLEDISEESGQSLEDYEKDFYEVDRDYTEDSNKLDLEMYRQKKEFAKDGIKFDVTKKYNDIVINQMKIELQQKKLKISMKSLEDTKLKNKLGLVTSMNMESAENGIQKSKDNIEKLIREQNDAKYELGQIIGKNVSNYKLEQQINYNPLKIEESELEDYLQGIMNNYIKLQNVEEVIQISDQYSSDYKEYLEDYKDKLKDQESEMNDYKNAGAPDREQYYITDEYGNRVFDSSAYQGEVTAYNIQCSKNEANYYQNELYYYGYKLKSYSNDLTNKNNVLDLESTKKDYMNKLRDYYTSLVNMQNNIITTQKDMEISNKELANTKLQYDLGMITKSDYDSELLKNEESQINLMSAINGCNQYRDMIEKPWISISANSTISKVSNSAN